MKRIPSTMRPIFVLQPLMVAVVALLGLVGKAGDVLAQTLPTGPTVVQGQAVVTTRGSQMTIISSGSGNAALNWQSFSIGSGASVRFEQPSSASQVLNRVTGSDPSSILGRLSSNGQVWLLNPNGILFGREARVDVASLVASTLHLDSADGRVQRFGLSESGTVRDGQAAVVNLGELRAATGGRIFLLGGAGGVRNEGLIVAPGGQVALMAGRSIDLIDEGLPNLTVRIQAPQGEALNLGTLSVEGGRIDLSAAIVNQQGIVRADALEGGRGGEIVLRATGTLDAGVTSLMSAQGGLGGQITLDSGPSGRTQVRGVLDATGSQGLGGGIRLLGRQIGLLGGAVVDVSGVTGGGVALVGGGFQGRDPGVFHAETVYVGPEVQLRADALGQGQGGQLIVWSDRATRVHGSLSARGGPLGGDGGLIETSGKWLDARPKAVRADATRGKAGVWLLDPYDLTISDDVEDSFRGVPEGDYFFVPDSQGPSTLSSLTLKTALESFGGTNVEVQTASGGPADGGDIVVWSANIRVAPQRPVGLRLSAARHIVFESSSIISTGAPLDVILNPGRASEVGGSIVLQNSVISTAGGLRAGVLVGNIHLGAEQESAISRGSSQGGNGSAVYLGNTLLDAGAGRIVARGISHASDLDAYGVLVDARSVLSAAEVSLQGTVVSSRSATMAASLGQLVGVAVDGQLNATRSIDLTGSVRGEITLATGMTPNPSGVGVDILGVLNLRPVGIDKTASLSVSGTASLLPINLSTTDLSWSMPIGVGFRTPESTLNVGGGATVTITGQVAAIQGRSVYAPSGTMSLSGAGDVRLSGHGGLEVGATVVAPTQAALTFTSTDPDSRIDLYPTRLSGAPSVLAVSADQVSLGGRIVLEGGGSAQVRAVSLATSSRVDGNAEGWPVLEFSSDGPVAFGADQIRLGLGTTIRSSARGDAIRLSGRATNLSSFVNEAGSMALGTPNGRWVIRATDPTDAARWRVGGLDHAAVVYGRADPDRDQALPEGNLLLFSVAPVLSRLDGGVRLGRTYDGTTTVSLTGTGMIGGEINGDRLFGAFADPSAGVGKTIGWVTALDGSVQGVDVQGKPVLGYRLATPFSLSGDVHPATLRYVAASATRLAGDPLDGFTGTVQGFVAGDTLQTATSGTLRFRAATEPAGVPGLHAIHGTGLSAANYTFVQAEGNATALSLLARPVEVGAAEALVLRGTQTALLPQTTSSATQGRVADALPNLSLAGNPNLVGGGVRAFGRVDVGTMSQPELSALLVARDQYKQSIFADALGQLADNPARADAPPCESIEQARAGTCLMTEALKAAYVATVQEDTASMVPASDPPEPARPATATPEVVARPAVAVAPPALQEVLSTRRPVPTGTVALPQIQRKLALVIGIDNHADRRVPGLDNARADARAVADVLTRRLGYETTLLTDGTRATILGQLNRLVLEARTTDSVVIYYAGHGSVVEKTGLGYWQPADADADRPETWISNVDIGRLIGQIASNQIALISDSCYSGRLVTGERIRPADQSVSAASLLDRKAVVVMSSGGNEPVADSGKQGHSTFAWSLMRAIEAVGSWRPGANVFEQVRFAVARELPQRPRYGAVLSGGHQAGADYVFESR